RSTAFPTFFETVKPTREGPSSRRSRICRTNVLVETLTPAAAARKSARCFNRCRGSPAPTALVSGAEALAPTPATGCHDFAAALGGHSGTETVTALAHELARLIRPFHQSLSAFREPNRR